MFMWLRRRKCAKVGHHLHYNDDKYRVVTGQPAAWCLRCDHVVL